jgi:hypothetical protein
LSVFLSAPLAGFLIQPLDDLFQYLVQPLQLTASLIKQPHYEKQRSEKDFSNGAKPFANGEKEHVKCGN